MESYEAAVREKQLPQHPDKIGANMEKQVLYHLLQTCSGLLSNRKLQPQKGNKFHQTIERQLHCDLIYSLPDHTSRRERYFTK